MRKKDLYQCEYCESIFQEYITRCPHCGGVSWKFPEDIHNEALSKEFTMEQEEETIIDLPQENNYSEERVPGDGYEENSSTQQYTAWESFLENVSILLTEFFSSAAVQLCLIVIINIATFFFMQMVILDSMESVLTFTQERINVFLESEQEPEVALYSDCGLISIIASEEKKK